MSNGIDKLQKVRLTLTEKVLKCKVEMGKAFVEGRYNDVQIQAQKIDVLNEVIDVVDREIENKEVDRDE